MSIPITMHLTLDEFASHDGVPYPGEWIKDRLLPLCHALEAIRLDLGGHPMTIVSGFRTAAHNAALRDADGSGTGVAQNSQHLLGRAADIAVDGIAPSDVHACALRLFKAGIIEIGGIGLYNGWVHVDVRERPESGHLAQWDGTGRSSANV